MEPYSSAMTELDVACKPAGHGWNCQVKITDGNGTRTEHTVSVSRAELKRFAGPNGEPHLLVNASFRFLLSNEPKESILRRFALSDIERYYQYYARSVASRLSR
jgi:hypothetical protein